MPKLILLQGGAATSFTLTEATTVIGRHPDCTVQVQSNMVSRKHAQIVIEDGRFVLQDLGSGNGSYVNGQQIQQPTVLHHDDRIKLGPILFRFEGDEAPVDPQATQPTMVGDKTPAAAVDFSSDDNGSTIVGSLESTAGFGLLDVQPQAKLRAVLDISRSLTGSIDVNSLLPRILETLFQIFPHADRGCILIRDESSGTMVPRAIKHRRDHADDSVKISRTILNTVLTQKKAILSADAASDKRFDASESISSLTIRSMMCVPLLGLSGDAMGVINIDTQNPIAQFRTDDLDIMVAVAGQAALSLENARLLATYVEKQKQDSEMRIASNVQRALLPDHMPELDGYEFFASYEAAQAVGGDYYDVFAVKNGKFCVAFGDVAGKGVPASLVMSRLSSVVRSTFQYVEQVDVAVSQINDHMCDKAVEGRFVTFVATLLDPADHSISVVNAGHMSPLIRRANGAVEELPEDNVGIPLGVIEGFSYQHVERTLDPGDTVVIYTDGVSEAMNPDSGLYSCERLRTFVSQAPGRASELGPAIRQDVKRHANGRPQNDDITLMVFGRAPS